MSILTFRGLGRYIVMFCPFIMSRVVFFALVPGVKLSNYNAATCNFFFFINTRFENTNLPGVQLSNYNAATVE